MGTKYGDCYDHNCIQVYLTWKKKGWINTKIAEMDPRDGNKNHINLFEYDSQPFFTEDPVAENQYQDNMTQEMSQSILQPPVKKCRKDNNGINKFTQTETRDENELQEQDEKDNPCDYCYSDKAMDKRNVHFGNLIAEEMQFVPPCARSEAYITIMKYVHSLKHKHVNN